MRGKRNYFSGRSVPGGSGDKGGHELAGGMRNHLQLATGLGQSFLAIGLSKKKEHFKQKNTRFRQLKPNLDGLVEPFARSLLIDLDQREPLSQRTTVGVTRRGQAQIHAARRLGLELVAHLDEQSEGQKANKTGERGKKTSKSAKSLAFQSCSLSES